jgi:hypothetical protein
MLAGGLLAARPRAATARREDGNVDRVGEQLLAAVRVENRRCGDGGVRRRVPVHPGRRYEDWTLSDPAGHPIDIVRPVRDEIEARVRELRDFAWSGTGVARHAAALSAPCASTWR